MGFQDFLTNLVNIGTKKTENTKTSINAGAGSGNTLFGDRAYTKTSTDNRDYSIMNAQTYNINSAGASGSSITTKKEVTTENTPSTSFEKPLSIAPALFGGGTTTATGEAKASSGINPIAIAGVVAVAGVGYFLLKGKVKKK